MDITSTTEAKSDQQNADDYLGGPKVVTVEKVTAGSADQPVEIHLVEFPGKPFKPSKTCRRVLIAAWGAEASNYAGRRMELFRDPTVKWAGEPVGGIRISRLSHIEKALTVSLAESRGKRKPTTVQPLIESPHASELASLRAEWVGADVERKAAIEARVAELNGSDA